MTNTNSGVCKERRGSIRGDGICRGGRKSQIENGRRKMARGKKKNQTKNRTTVERDRDKEVEEGEEEDTRDREGDKEGGRGRQGQVRREQGCVCVCVRPAVFNQTCVHLDQEAAMK